MNDTELEFSAGINDIKRQVLALKQQRDLRTFRRLRISCLFLEALAIFALEERAISDEFYKSLKMELKNIYKEVKRIKDEIQTEWEKELI